ncbi:MAG: SGNH/GDSL hydrolase family protein [Blastocatellia bacterium]|nr:SGNH/GDSL hydrolase family protein [Blastocatellia bacterium]
MVMPASRRKDVVIANSIIVFGDSITQGGALPIEQRSNAWICLVETASNGNLQLINEGKGGRPTDSLNEFTAMLQQQARPTALALALGTNDSRDVSGQCVPKAVANLKAMVVAARKAYGEKLPILLIGPPNINKNALGPTRPIADEREANLRELGLAYEKLAQETGCQFVNLFGVIPAESLTKDGVHPDVRGNEAIANKLLPALSRLAGIGMKWK